MSYDTLTGLLTGVADAIRAKDGSTDSINAQDFPDKIAAITTGSDTSDATATASDILSGKTAYTASGKVTGTIGTSALSVATPTVALDTGKVTATATATAGNVASKQTATGTLSLSTVTPGTPSISVDSSGLVTASATTNNGYVTSGSSGTKKATYQLETASVGTPSISVSTDGTVSASSTTEAGYLSTDTTKSATHTLSSSDDADFVAGNIKSGVTIFGTTGTYEGQTGTDTSDATATAADILSGKTAYADGEKVTGTISTVTPGSLSLSLSGTTVSGSCTTPAGYVASSTTKTNTLSLGTASVGTPSISASGSTITARATTSKGYLGSSTTKSNSVSLSSLDSNFTAANIASGVSMFGVTGTYTGSGKNLTEFCYTNGDSAYNALPATGYIKFAGSIATSDGYVWGISQNSYIRKYAESEGTISSGGIGSSDVDVRIVRSATSDGSYTYVNIYEGDTWMYSILTDNIRLMYGVVIED